MRLKCIWHATKEFGWFFLIKNRKAKWINSPPVQVLPGKIHFLLLREKNEQIALLLNGTFYSFEISCFPVKSSGKSWTNESAQDYLFLVVVVGGIHLNTIILWGG